MASDKRAVRERFVVGTRVALYMRRSTDEHQAESLDTQLGEAKRYCEARGWLIVEEYVDDAVSRAEFKKRPGLIRMLNAAKDGQFRAVITRDETRLGGDTYRTGMVMQDLIDDGVDLVYYYTDEVVAMDGAVDKFLVAARNFASELEREKISQRTHEHLTRKARVGRPAGGIAYGYRIVHAPEKAYEVHPDEAPKVLRIFSAYAAGSGLRTIAHQLNAEHIPSPRAGKRGTGSWAPSAIRAILRNPRYRGQGRYNHTGKLYRGGTKVREKRDAVEHIEYVTPRIVEDELWLAVQARFGNNARFGDAVTRKGCKARYLLSGIGRCGRCGGPITVANGKRGEKNARVYLCGWHRDRGRAVCDSGLRQPVDAVDASITSYIQRTFLTEEVIAEVCSEVRRRLTERRGELPDLVSQTRVEAE